MYREGEAIILDPDEQELLGVRELAFTLSHAALLRHNIERRLGALNATTDAHNQRLFGADYSPGPDELQFINPRAVRLQSIGTDLQVLLFGAELDAYGSRQD